MQALPLVQASSNTYWSYVSNTNTEPLPLHACSTTPPTIQYHPHAHISHPSAQQFLPPHVSSNMIGYHPYYAHLSPAIPYAHPSLPLAQSQYPHLPLTTSYPHPSFNFHHMQP